MMNNIKLRNHIPISGPATREPCTGDEPYLRLSLGFTPGWYHRLMGVDFSEHWHTDPVYRYGTLLTMKKTLHGMFPDIPYFCPVLDERGIEHSCATLSGVYGIKLIPMLYGQKVRYFNDDWPDNMANDFISKEELSKLSPFNLESLPAYCALMDQMDVIEREYGMIHGYLNYQGILNIALKLRGNDIFIDMLDDPPFAHHLFAHIADTIGRTAAAVQARQRRSGFDIDLLSMSNCVINMISPDMYEEFLLPHDIALSRRFARFGIHTCNWNGTPYFPSLHKIEKMGYLDTGFCADLKLAKALFPDTNRAVLYHPISLEEKDTGALEADMRRIASDYGPCDIIMADVAESTPPQKVSLLISIINRLSDEYASSSK